MVSTVRFLSRLGLVVLVFDDDMLCRPAGLGDGPSSNPLLHQPERTYTEGVSAKLRKLLDDVPDGGSVAVITYAGSFCPPTRAHILCLVEAQKLILGATPPHLVVGLVFVNRDGRVQRKLPQHVKVLSERESLHLLDLAIEETGLAWVDTYDGMGRKVDEIRQA